MSAKTKMLRKHYGKLGAQERFRLVVAAAGRGDMCEMRALADSAPKSTYKVPAYPYRGMIMGLRNVFTQTLITILDSGVAMCSFFFFVLNDSAARNEGATQHDEIWKLTVGLAGCVKAAWDGLVMFCEEVGITVEDARALAPSVELLDSVVTMAEDVIDLKLSFPEWLKDEYFPQTGAQSVSTSARNLWKEWRESKAQEGTDAARKYADSLRMLWDGEAGLGQ